MLWAGRVARLEAGRNLSNVDVGGDFCSCCLEGQMRGRLLCLLKEISFANWRLMQLFGRETLRMGS